MFPLYTIEKIHDHIIFTLRNYFSGASKNKAIIGLSGGIDSAVVASLAVRAFGKDSVTGVLMPSPYSTLHSVNDAVELAENLGIKFHISPIDKILSEYLHEISKHFEEEPHRLTVENLQARIRSVILMSFSNQLDALLLNTTNKSELAMGYGTMYGDLSGAIMPVADLYKRDIYELANYINVDNQIIPDSTLTKAPSAELSPGQKDSDSIPEYSLLDPILYSLIEEGEDPHKLISKGVDKDLMEKILSLMKGAAFKVHQLPQIIRLNKNPLLPKNKWL